MYAVTIVKRCITCHYDTGSLLFLLSSTELVEEGSVVAGNGMLSAVGIGTSVGVSVFSTESPSVLPLSLLMGTPPASSSGRSLSSSND